jgi:hypothetical protein
MAIMASPAEKARIGFLGMDEDGKWRMLPANPETSPSPALNLRREAIQFVKRRGIRFIVARSGYQGHLVTGRALTASPGDWGVVPVATYEDVVLFRIR